MTVDELLDQIDDMIDKAWSMPLSGGKCLIEADHLRDIIDDIRGNMPSEIRQARAIVADRTDIVATAKREAEGIIRTAEERARSMVSHEEVVRQAQAKAKEILSQYQQKAREMRKGAQEFSEDVLRSADIGASADGNPAGAADSPQSGAQAQRGGGGAAGINGQDPTKQTKTSRRRKAGGSFCDSQLDGDERAVRRFDMNDFQALVFLYGIQACL